MKGELPVFYCKHCGLALEPNWYEGDEGRIRYDEVDGRPYKEYRVFYKCSVKRDFWGFHSQLEHIIRKSADSNYRLPESVKEYLRVN